MLADMVYQILFLYEVGMKPGDLFFVYGTLRQTGRFHYLIASQEFVTNGTITGTMYSISGMCPAVRLTPEGVVTGEVYRITSLETIRNLCQLENGYEHSKVIVECADGEPCLAWCFHIGGTLWGRNLDTMPVVDGGDWMKFSERKV